MAVREKTRLICLWVWVKTCVTYLRRLSKWNNHILSTIQIPRPHLMILLPRGFSAVSSVLLAHPPHLQIENALLRRLVRLILLSEDIDLPCPKMRWLRHTRRRANPRGVPAHLHYSVCINHLFRNHTLRCILQLLLQRLRKLVALPLNSRLAEVLSLPPIMQAFHQTIKLDKPTRLHCEYLAWCGPGKRNPLVGSKHHVYSILVKPTIRCPD